MSNSRITFLLLVRLASVLAFISIDPVTKSTSLWKRSCDHRLSQRSEFSRQRRTELKMSVDDRSKKPKKKGTGSSKQSEEKSRKKEELMKQLKDRLDEKKKKEKESSKPSGGLLDKLNPFHAGQNLRQTLRTLTSLGTGLCSSVVS